MGSKSKLQVFEAKYGEIREKLLASAAHFGRLLWLSLTEGFNLDFKELKFSKFVDDKTLDVDQSGMLRAVLSRSGKHNLNASEIAEQLATMSLALHDPWHVCSGHHLTEILAIALCKAIGTHDAREMSAEQVATMLTLAYEAADFPSTGLYADIRAWEHASPPFVVLA